MRTVLFPACVIIALIATTTILGTSARDLVFPPAPATVDVHASLFNKIADAVIPLINDEVRKLVIPGKSEKHFKYDDIHFSEFKLGAVSFSFVSPNEVAVKISSLSMAIPKTDFWLYDKILFIHVHCHGQFWASVDARAGFSMKLTDKDGKIAVVGNADANVDIENLNIGQKMLHFLCKIGDDILKLFLGDISKKIKEALNKDLGPVLEKVLTAAIQKEFAKLPIRITGDPVAKNDGISLPIDLDSLIKSSSSSLSTFLMQQQQMQRRPRHHDEHMMLDEIMHPPRRHSHLSQRRQISSSAGDRDVSVILPQTSVNTLLRSIQSTGKLAFNDTEKKMTTKIFELILPEAYKACPDCDINLGVDVAVAPVVMFSHSNATLVADNVTLAIGAVNPNSTVGAVMPLFALSLNLDLSVDNFTVTGNMSNIVHFDLGVNNLHIGVKSSHVGPVPASTLNWLANLIIKTVIPIFNKKFPGIPFPAEIDDLLIDVASGTFTAGLNLAI